MNASRPRKNRGRRFQFSMLGLLITTSIVGPLLGLYGPAAYSRLHELIAPAPQPKSLPPVWVQTRARLAARRQQLRARLQQLQQQSDVVAARIRQLEIEREMDRLRINARGITDEMERGMQADHWQTHWRRRSADGRAI